jgi:hypothetical protein
MSATVTPGGSAATRLGRLARQARTQNEARQEHCEFCAQLIPPEHRHVLELRSGELRCACRPCALLFDRDGARSGDFRTVGERRWSLGDFRIDAERWQALGVPVDMVFFVRSSVHGRMRALYPSPAGATEAALDIRSWWAALEAENPVLARLTDDVEALLVDRVREHRRYFVVPIDDAYRMVALVRTHWRGIMGGTPLWRAVDAFFDDLARSARPAPAGRDTPPTGGRKEAP